MSDNGFDDILDQLDQLGRDIEAAAVRGLTAGTGNVQAAAQASAAYNDDSGATRASTIAFVVAGNDGDDGAVGAALAAADEKRPGSAQALEISFIDRENPHVVATAMTRYVEPLVVKYASAHDFLGPTMESEAPRLQDAAFAAIEQVMQ